MALKRVFYVTAKDYILGSISFFCPQIWFSWFSADDLKLYEYSMLYRDNDDELGVSKFDICLAKIKFVYVILEMDSSSKIKLEIHFQNLFIILKFVQNGVDLVLTHSIAILKNMIIRLLSFSIFFFLK